MDRLMDSVLDIHLGVPGSSPNTVESFFTVKSLGFVN